MTPVFFFIFFWFMFHKTFMSASPCPAPNADFTSLTFASENLAPLICGVYSRCLRSEREINKVDWSWDVNVSFFARSPLHPLIELKVFFPPCSSFGYFLPSSGGESECGCFHVCFWVFRHGSWLPMGQWAAAVSLRESNQHAEKQQGSQQ